MNITINNKKYYIKNCKTFSSRLLGLMFKKNISYGCYFKKCKSIHTFFMKENIDIIFLDKSGQIIDIKENIKPYKIITSKKNTYSILELPSNLGKHFKINETLDLFN